MGLSFGGVSGCPFRSGICATLRRCPHVNVIKSTLVFTRVAVAIAVLNFLLDYSLFCTSTFHVVSLNNGSQFCFTFIDNILLNTWSHSL